MVAHAPLDGSAPITLLAIPQRTAAGEVDTHPLLPSVRYQAAVGELPSDALAQPWPALGATDVSPAIVGRYARELGAAVPGRVVASAKSWLSHAGVDRSAPILPWGAPEGEGGVAKISPLLASASYLAHVRNAWDAQHPDAPLAQQRVVLTVPASFDEGARALTLEAAQLAGLPEVHLLEEPKAAFHDWLVLQGAQVGAALQGSQQVLVVDVGGGTTDLTLIRVDAPEIPGGLPVLTRTGVGEHLMLGGDNMDLALAHLLELQLSGEGQRLPPARFAQLAHLPLNPIRGQVSHAAATPASQALRAVLCGESYISPARLGQHCFGATFRFKQTELAVTTEEHQENLDKLAALTADGWARLGGAALTPAQLGGRSGWRATTPDYLPLVGPVAQAEQFAQHYPTPERCGPRQPGPAAPWWPGLYVSLAHGSRGLITAPLAGEALAAALHGDPAPLPGPLLEALHPNRFLLRAQKRRHAPEHRP